jgi:hypothetical protein
MRKSIPIGALAVALAGLTATGTVAQSYYAPAPVPAPAPPRVPFRVEVYPRVHVQYYRDCVDGYAVEQRLTGPTVVPRMNCRWAKRYYTD